MNKEKAHEQSVDANGHTINDRGELVFDAGCNFCRIQRLETHPLRKKMGPANNL
jgi:hypothetical protein